MFSPGQDSWTCSRAWSREHWEAEAIWGIALQRHEAKLFLLNSPEEGQSFVFLEEEVEEGRGHCSHSLQQGYPGVRLLLLYIICVRSMMITAVILLFSNDLHYESIRKPLKAILMGTIRKNLKDIFGKHKKYIQKMKMLYLDFQLKKT